MKSRKKFTKDFKISVLCELENNKTAAQLCREHDIHSSMLSKRKREYKENPEMAFSGVYLHVVVKKTYKLQNRRRPRIQPDKVLE